MVFLDESGFLLIPNVARTWAPKGETPLVRSRYKQDRISAISALAVSPQRKRLALSLTLRTRNLTGLDVRAFLQHLLRHLRGSIQRNMSGPRPTAPWPTVRPRTWSSSTGYSATRCGASEGRHHSCGPVSTRLICRGHGDPFHYLCTAQ
ncbi:MAG: transposase [Nitrospirae bacterium]|nr:transposase [Nitrospirota bacterium]